MAKILIVDDELALTELLLMLVEENGHEGLVAHNGLEALQIARQVLPDLVISDIMMPIMTGLELLASIRADPLLALTPVILISAASEPPAAREVAIYLRKPFELAMLEQIIERLTLPLV